MQQSRKNYPIAPCNPQAKETRQSHTRLLVQGQAITWQKQKTIKQQTNTQTHKQTSQKNKNKANANQQTTKQKAKQNNQTNKQTNKQANKQTSKQQADKTNKQTTKQPNKQTQTKQTNSQDKQTDKQTNAQCSEFGAHTTRPAGRQIKYAFSASVEDLFCDRCLSRGLVQWIDRS